MYQRVCREHRKICDLADDVLRTVVQGDFTEAEVAGKRLAFCRALNAQGLADRKTLDTMMPMLIERRADLWRLYSDELQRWRYSLVSFNAQWPLSRLVRDPARFATEFRQLISMLRARFHWEEMHFYPQLINLPAAPAAPTPVVTVEASNVRPRVSASPGGTYLYSECA